MAEGQQFGAEQVLQKEEGSDVPGALMPGQEGSAGDLCRGSSGQRRLLRW